MASPARPPAADRRARPLPLRRSTPPRAGGAGDVLELLERSRTSLLLACRAGDSAERYLDAHLAALRAAAALLASRTGPTTRSRPRSVWEVLPVVAPELVEWATFFAGSARRRVVIERGDAPSARESDDLLRQAEIFFEIVQDLLGVPRAEPLPDYIAPVTVSPVAVASVTVAPVTVAPPSGVLAPGLPMSSAPRLRA